MMFFVLQNGEKHLSEEFELEFNGCFVFHAFDFRVKTIDKKDYILFQN